VRIDDVGAVLLTESLYAYQYMSLYASGGEVLWWFHSFLNLWHISAFVMLALGYLELTGCGYVCCTGGRGGTIFHTGILSLVD